MDEMRERCPHCDQLMVYHRLGVSLGGIKARLFDLVERAGADGIDANELFDAVLASRGCSRLTLKAHVRQINDLIEDTGFRIRAVPAGSRYRRYRLFRINESPKHDDDEIGEAT